MNKLAFFFDRRNKEQRESDKIIKKDWTKKPYPTKKPEWRNLWNSDTRGGQTQILRGGNTSGVTSKQVLNHFKKKYKLDVGFNSYTDPAYVNSFYVPPEYSRDFRDGVREESKNRKLNFLERHLTTKKYKENVFKRINEFKKLKKTVDKNYKRRDGNLGMDKEVMKHSPEVIAHELGHAHNYTKSKHKKLYNFLNGSGGALIGLGGVGAYLALRKRNPLLGIGLMSATSLVSPIATLVDEYQASKKGTNAIKELGGHPHPKKLRSAFNSYLAEHGSDAASSLITLGAAGLLYKYRHRL